MNKYVITGLVAAALVVLPAIGASGSGARTRTSSVPVTGSDINPNSISTGIGTFAVVDAGVLLLNGQTQSLGTVFASKSSGTSVDATACTTGQFCFKMPNNSGIFMGASDTIFQVSVANSSSMLLNSSAATFPGVLTGAGLFTTLSNGTAGSGTGITTNATGASALQIHKITVINTALTAAGSTDITIWTLPAKTRVQRVIADVTTKFIGGALTAVTLTCGISAGDNKYLLSGNVFANPITLGDGQAEWGTNIVGATGFTGGDIPNWSTTQIVSCRFTCTTANCNAATQGSVTFYIEHVVYP